MSTPETVRAAFAQTPDPELVELAAAYIAATDRLRGTDWSTARTPSDLAAADEVLAADAALTLALGLADTMTVAAALYTLRGINPAPSGAQLVKFLRAVQADRKH